jgi:hypothetical protein
MSVSLLQSFLMMKKHGDIIDGSERCMIDLSEGVLKLLLRIARRMVLHIHARQGATESVHAE